MDSVAEQLALSRRALVAKACEDFAHWAPQLHCAPVPGAVLPGGYNHHVQLIEGPAQRWLMRIDKRTRDVRQRELEASIQHSAAAHNIAPAMAFCDPTRGISIMEWIEGSQDTLNNTSEIARLLRRVHALPLQGETLKSTEVLRRHRASLAADCALQSLLCTENPQLTKAISIIEGQSNIPQLLCHNDLLRANRLRSKQGLYALDWEYAAPGDPLFDLAVCASELPGCVTHRLVEEYLQRAPTAAESQRFSAQCLIYACIEACWFSVHEAGSVAARLSCERVANKLSNKAGQ